MTCRYMKKHSKKECPYTVAIDFSHIRNWNERFDAFCKSESASGFFFYDLSKQSFYFSDENTAFYFRISMT
jgi:hypothetical protein